MWVFVCCRKILFAVSDERMRARRFWKSDATSSLVMDLEMRSLSIYSSVAGGEYVALVVSRRRYADPGPESFVSLFMTCSPLLIHLFPNTYRIPFVIWRSNGGRSLALFVADIIFSHSLPKCFPRNPRA